MFLEVYFLRGGKKCIVIKESRRESSATNTSLIQALLLLFLQLWFSFVLYNFLISWLSRATSASVRKNGENLSDSLKLLGYRYKEREWMVFDDINIQNARNGLVSFELNEHLER